MPEIASFFSRVNVFNILNYFFLLRKESLRDNQTTLATHQPISVQG
jgi:hypothetical protein